MTIDECKVLKHGEILHHVRHKNADGTPERWRVNGKVQTWRRDINRVKVPVARGLYQHDYLTEHNCHLLVLPQVEQMTLDEADRRNR